MAHGIPKMRPSGFSLIELLIYTAIVAGISIMIATFFITINRSYAQIEARTEVNSALRFAVEKINQDVRTASSITTPSSPGSSSDSLALVIGGSTVTYQLSSGHLQRQVNASAPEDVTASSVRMTALSFTRMENTNTVFSRTIASVEIDLTVEYNSSSTDFQYSARKKTVMSLR